MDLGIRDDWEKETKIHDGEYVHMGLRRTLQAIGIPMLAEVWTGQSHRGFQSVDVYTSHWSVGMPLETITASHYVVYGECDISDRDELAPEKWYIANVWIPYGQVSDVLEWKCDIKEAVLKLAKRYANASPLDVFGIADEPVRAVVTGILGNMYPHVREYRMDDDDGQEMRLWYMRNDEWNGWNLWWKATHEAPEEQGMIVRGIDANQERDGKIMQQPKEYGATTLRPRSRM